ncbi:hypothetical protein FGO68_gene3194 [Halteria grandinella]|uniref:AIG1-type G domain-containing protein n=1 Tax=Halteria grandinella TaxID=5974 RepID=A0A8J8NP73_HALGN|nr:hypothetical protein FGO68_gene3194 [Halteria grandinella]
MYYKYIIHQKLQEGIYSRLVRLTNMESSHKQTIVVIGETGVGKSTLCNCIIGKEFFQTGEQLMTGCTMEAMAFSGKTIFDDLVKIIDTCGYNDPEGKDYENSLKMVNLIKGQSQGINSFLLVFNGQNIRWNVATIKILELLDATFPDFWTNVIVVINFMPQSEGEIRKRQRSGRSDIQIRTTIKNELSKKFGIPSTQSLPVYCVDCFYDDRIDSEKDHFIGSLKNILTSSKSLSPYKPDRVQAQKTEIMKLEEGKKQAEEKAQRKIDKLQEKLKEKEREDNRRIQENRKLRIQMEQMARQKSESQDQKIQDLEKQIKGIRKEKYDDEEEKRQIREQQKRDYDLQIELLKIAEIEKFQKQLAIQEAARKKANKPQEIESLMRKISIKEHEIEENGKHKRLLIKGGPQCAKCLERKDKLVGTVCKQYTDEKKKQDEYELKELKEQLAQKYAE